MCEKLSMRSRNQTLYFMNFIATIRFREETDERTIYILYVAKEKIVLLP
jgi:hypothetical protein